MYTINVLLSFFAALFTIASAGNSKQLDEDTILTLYRDAQQSLNVRRWMYKAEETLVISGAVLVEMPDETIRTYTVFRDHDRIDCRMEQSQVFGQNDNGDAERTTQHKFQYLIDKGQYFKYGYNIIAEQEPKFIRITTSRKNLGKRNPSLSDVEKALAGCIRGDEDIPIWAIMKDSSSVLRLRPSMEEIDDHDTYVLEADTKYGHYTLWVDHNCGYNARRIEVSRVDDDLFWGQPVNSPPPPLGPHARPTYPNNPRKQVSHVVDSVIIKKFENVFIPVAAKSKMTYVYENKQEVKMQQTYKRMDINLKPDFESIPTAFSLLAPDGSTVHDLEVPAAIFECRDGKVVAKVDESYLHMLDNVAEGINIQSDGNEPPAEIEETKTSLQEPISNVNEPSYISGQVRQPSPQHFSLRILLVLMSGILLIIYFIIRYIKRGKYVWTKSKH